MKLDEITSETVADFTAYRQAAGLQVSTVNSSLQVLRRTLLLALEWGATRSIPSVKMLPAKYSSILVFARRVFSAALGMFHLDQRTIWDAFGHPWKN